MTLFNNSFVNSLLCVSPYHRMLCMLFCIICATRMRCFYVYLALIWKKTAHPCGAADTEERTPQAYCSDLPKWRYADLERHRGEELLNKVVIFVFFMYKKYSRRFITLRLNHWWQMDYSDDAFHTFLDLDTVIYLPVYGTVSSLPVFIQNILNCVPKMNESFYGFEMIWG